MCVSAYRVPGSSGPVQTDSVGSLSASRWQQQGDKPGAGTQVTQPEASPGAWRACSEVSTVGPGWAGLEQHMPGRRVTSSPVPLPMVLWPLTAGTPAPPGSWSDCVQPGSGGAHLGLRSRWLEEAGCWATPDNWVSLSGTSSRPRRGGMRGEGQGACEGGSSKAVRVCEGRLLC